MYRCHNNRNFLLLFISFSLLTTSLRGQKYISIGPSVGFYGTKDTLEPINDVIRVRSKLRMNKIAVEASIGYKNEMYGNDLVWVRSWPVAINAEFYPLSFFYIGGGVGISDIYIDYNQSVAELRHYENESKLGFEASACFGFEKELGKTSVFAVLLSKTWIDYGLRQLPAGQSFDTNSWSVEATLLFKIGVSD